MRWQGEERLDGFLGLVDAPELEVSSAVVGEQLGVRDACGRRLGGPERCEGVVAGVDDEGGHVDGLERIGVDVGVADVCVEDDPCRAVSHREDAVDEGADLGLVRLGEREALWDARPPNGTV